MKKLLLTFILLFSANAAFADCDMKNIGLGKDFSDLKEKYKMNSISAGSKKFYKNIRGVDICPALQNSEVSMLFLKNKLAQVRLYRISDNSGILDVASSNFGMPDKLPNKDDPKLDSYSTYWNTEENAIAYSFSISPDRKTFTEKLTMQNKELGDEFTKFAITDEDKKENNNNEDE